MANKDFAFEVKVRVLDSIECVDSVLGTVLRRQEFVQFAIGWLTKSLFL